MKNNYPTNFTHKDGRKLRQVAMSYLDEGEESKAIVRLNSLGFTARTTVFHKTDDGKYLHVGAKDECTLTNCARNKLAVEPSTMVSVDAKLPIVEDKLGKLNTSVSSEPLEGRIPKPLNNTPIEKPAEEKKVNDLSKDNEAYKLNIKEKIINAIDKMHSTLFFGPNSHLPEVPLKKTFTCQVTGTRVMLGPQPSLALTFKPSKDMIKYRDELTKLGFKHNRDDWLPHVSLEYNEKPETIDVNKFKLPKKITFNAISRRIVK